MTGQGQAITHKQAFWLIRYCGSSGSGAEVREVMSDKEIYFIRCVQITVIGIAGRGVLCINKDGLSDILYSLECYIGHGSVEQSREHGRLYARVVGGS